ncbi:MAG: gamma-butyrobetaine hydroxylase-like domain-containing protein [Alphaproteobacteria bacterium]
MQPTSLTLTKDKRSLTLHYGPAIHTLTAHTLRMESPSAEVKGHFGQGGITPVGKENVTITALEPVGTYALKIVFSDGHQTGLYTWEYLYGLTQTA